MKSLFLSLLLPVFLMLAPTGCATHDPVGAADTVESKAYALYGIYVIAEETAADFVESKATPDSVVKAVRDANRIARPAVHVMRDLALRYTLLRAEIDAAQKVGLSGVAEKVAIAEAVLKQLTDAYVQAEPLAKQFISAVHAQRR